MVERVPKPLLNIEDKPMFRADTDHNGDWHVWRQMSANGWATMRRCESRNDAVRLADSLNIDGPIGGLIGPIA